MKHTVLAITFVSIMFFAVVAFGQTPPPLPPRYDPYSLSSFGVKPRPVCAWYEFWCSESVYWNQRLSPETKRKLSEHDPNVCHCSECRRARLAAGVEYQGLTPYYDYMPRRRVVPPPPVYTPPKPRDYGGFYIYCSSTNSVITRDQCPDK
jgi:hypothetical protein